MSVFIVYQNGTRRPQIYRAATRELALMRPPQKAVVLGIVSARREAVELARKHFSP